MTTQEMVTWILEDIAPGFSRTKILAYLKRAQNEVFNHDCAQTTFLNWDDTEFPIPFLSTTATVLDYLPSTSNLVDSAGSAISLTWNGYAVTIRKIKHVFMQVSGLTSSYDNTFIGRVFDWAGINDNWSKKVYKIRYRLLPGMPYDKSDLEGAKWVFAEDPGTHTDKYYCEFYVGPVNLSSESIPMSLDSDRWAEALFTAVRGYMEVARYGRSELLDGPRNSGSFRKYWLPQIWGSWNLGLADREPFVFDTRRAL